MFGCFGELSAWSAARGLSGETYNWEVLHMFKTFIARTVCAAAVLSLGMSVAANALAEDIVVVGWGGASQDALRTTFFQPYVAETGNNIVEDSWNGGIRHATRQSARRFSCLGLRFRLNPRS